MATGGATAGAVAAAAAAAHARRLLVGGLLVELPPQAFQELAGRLKTLVITGNIGGLFGKSRLYLLPYNGITFYCKTKAADEIYVEAIEVPKIDKGPLSL